MKFKLVSILCWISVLCILSVFETEARPKSADDVVYDQLVPPPGSDLVDSLAYSVLVQHLKSRQPLTEADGESRITSYYVLDTQQPPQRVRSSSQYQSESVEVPSVISLSEEDTENDQEEDTYTPRAPSSQEIGVAVDSFPSAPSERRPPPTQYTKSVQNSVQAFLQNAQFNSNLREMIRTRPSEEQEYSTAMVITMPKKSSHKPQQTTTTPTTTTTTTRRPPQIPIKQFIQINPQGPQYGQILNPQALRRNKPSYSNKIASIRDALSQKERESEEEESSPDNAIEKAVELLTQFSDDFINENDRKHGPQVVALPTQKERKRGQSLSNAIDTTGLPLARRPFTLKHFNNPKEGDRFLGVQSSISVARPPRYFHSDRVHPHLKRNSPETSTLALLSELRNVLESAKSARHSNSNFEIQERKHSEGKRRNGRNFQKSNLKLPVDFEIFKSVVREI